MHGIIWEGHIRPDIAVASEERNGWFKVGAREIFYCVLIKKRSKGSQAVLLRKTHGN